jgi:circadian clock protein KaiC
VLLGGGLVAGTNTLMLGPSGVGKSTLSVRCMLSALERGERAAYYLFDEGLGTFVARNAGFGMDLRPHIDSGALRCTTSTRPNCRPANSPRCCATPSNSEAPNSS